ncbi:Cyclomaltodextrinase [Aquisphaera giovannonii]|uniref:Cyclomaltodextrinase n=1 Tax=Aquisphaera giovannonii TaxID=406548 RepID=A0A5B9W427_9BACT|nr:alpha-amylase family glycosyl hydrolase [Aquisphaera giovannonii]QEH35363.1 Cyclomaltodextrinase [Aquisphaera giovannonii]
MPAPLANGLPRRLLLVLSTLAILAAAAAPAPAQQATAKDVAKLPARPRPQWVTDAVIYELFPRNFSNEGNFAGVTARLDELKDLGVDVLWLMPIHPIGQKGKKGTVGSPYAVRDYDAINPDYGTAEDLKRLVAEAHKRGLKVILDIVANHTAWDSVLMEKHPDFYTRDASGKVLPPNPDWTDVADLNYDNPALRDYMVGMLKRWVKEFDVDGFRCDVAMEVPTDFWERVRDELAAIKPDIFLLAEASKPELLVKAFDADYAWPLHGTLAEVMMSGRPATAIRDAWKEQKAAFPKGAVHVVFSDNHDERRAIVRFGERGAMAAAVLIFTLDGIPLIYNGMEFGDSTESGAPALFEKLPILRPISERRPEFAILFRQLIALRRDHPALRSGDLAWLPTSDEDRIVAFLRRDAKEEILVAINLSNRPFRGRIADLPAQAAAFRDITPTLKAGVPSARASGRSGAQPPALPELSLPAWGFRVLQRMLP